ncbi:hypothetical protein DH2020_009900 [Rehmannia glutinosa]|uniref:non-specific serine/threonine protein kinase n=1 Tax=Rehmannia glutinosa TaxID=99300 RepID=A0ABR0X9P9_REHGL
MDRRLLSRKGWDIEMSIQTPEKQVMYSDHLPSNEEINNNVDFVGRYMLRDIEEATNGLAYENVIGSGDYGEVFQGFLMDNTHVAVKKLFSNRSSKESFVREAEAMMLIRHKNLVKLLGYCAEGTNSLAYLHEDTEPPVVHGNIKSSNILVDQQWNPKISNVGITKFLGPEYNHLATAPPTGMPGYIAPEYDSRRGSDEKSDVYSFGVLIMETVSGKTVVESTVSEIEECLVDWIKYMVAEEKYDLIIDPNLPEYPSRKELKRILLIALRCVDFEVGKRPKMGEVIHMLQPRDLLLSDENVIKRQTSQSISLKEEQT